MNRVFIIAEAGVNHNGSLELARQLIDVAARAGADAVKFQSFRADQLVSRNTPKAEYQIDGEQDPESHYDMIKRLELSEIDHADLIARCRARSIQFLSSPFDLDSAEMLLHRFNLLQIKVASGEVTNAPLLLRVAQAQRRVILSTGMSTLEEVEAALGVLAFGYMGTSATPSVESFRAAYASLHGKEAIRDRVTLLHCTSEYPAAPASVNLRAMDVLKDAFGLPVGYSDHTQGITFAVAAVARGAEVLEKHLTLDKTLPGPDHRASLEPHELETMVSAVRCVELALGDARKAPTSGEMRNLPISRKSLVAATKIAKGSLFDASNITVKRPGFGVSPFRYWEYLGRTATRDYEPDALIDP